jgi:hypothetical protein
MYLPSCGHEKARSVVKVVLEEPLKVARPDRLPIR